MSSAGDASTRASPSSRRAAWGAPKWRNSALSMLWKAWCMSSAGDGTPSCRRTNGMDGRYERGRALLSACEGGDGGCRQQEMCPSRLHHDGHRTAWRAPKRQCSSVLSMLWKAWCRSCAYRGCPKQPSYGMEDTKAAEFCSQHAVEGMVDVKRKRCAH